MSASFRGAPHTPGWPGSGRCALLIGTGVCVCLFFWVLGNKMFCDWLDCLKRKQ